MSPEILLMVIMTGVIGATIGTFTGLIPGIHVNTAATILLGLYPSMLDTISGFVNQSYAPVLVSCIIMSASAVHSFVDFVPSVFIGVPEADDALSVLPGHRLFLKGQGMKAVRAAAIGSVIGSASALALAIPLQWIMLSGGSEYIDYFTNGIILVTLAVVLLTSNHRMISSVLLVISGIMGMAVNDGIIPIYALASGGTMLFPLLTGMFGIPPLLDKCKNHRPVKQTDDETDPVGPEPGLKGVLTGVIAGWFPGVTSTAGAALTSAFSEEHDPARFISMTASIGTVTAVFSIVTLSVSGSGRSGTSMVVKEIIGDSLKGLCSEAFLLILLSIAIASAIGYFVTIGGGKLMARVSERIREAAMNDCILVLIVILAFLFTGPFGLVLLVISAMIGMIPPATGTSRICLTGCLMVPVLVSI